MASFHFDSIYLSSILLFALPLGFNSVNLSVSAQVSSTDKKTDTDRLFQQGVEQFRAGAFQASLQTYQQVLTIRSNLNDKAGIAETLDNIGEVHTSLSDYDKALDTFQQALTIRSQLNDEAGIGETLNNLGYVYRLMGEYLKALELHERAFKLGQKINNRAIEGESLHNIAAVYAAQSEYDRALELYLQALAIRREIGDSRDEGRTLNNIGGIYYSLGQYEQAIDYYQQALTIRKTLGDRAGIGRILSNIGLVYRQLGEYSPALKFYQEALPILQEIGDKASIGSALNGMGVIYENLGQYDKALEIYQQSLSIAKEIGDRSGMGNTFDNVGGISYSYGRYSQAIEFYQKALSIRREIGDRVGIANSLNNLGGVYYNLGQYPQALEFFQQALAIHRVVGNQVGEYQTLDGIGIIYENMKQYAKALEYYQQSLAISQKTGARSSEGETLALIGGVYNNLGQYSQAKEFLQQALTISQKIGDRAGEGRTLNSISGIYYSLRQYNKALEYLQQSLAILQEVSDKSGEIITITNIAYLLEQQKQSALAIIFYKQAVNLTESIRKDLKVLSVEQQQSFTNTVADTYRRLADLLLKHNRVLEAQKVLDLLKVQEVAEYLNNVRGNDQTLQGVDLLPQERQISEKYAEAIKLGKELAQLRSIPDARRTPTQQQRIVELEKMQQEQRAEFNQFIRSSDIVALVEQLNWTSGSQNIDLPNLNRLQRNLQQLQQPALLLYPLILEDRLELVLVTPYSPPIHRPVAVKREDLNRIIVQFRQALQNPTTDASIPAGKLYNLLIKPIEKELLQAEAQTILYAPDGVLRYVPLAALHDGKQWLVQRFSINNITAASLTDFNAQVPDRTRILAAAFTKGSYNVPVGTRQMTLAGLPFAAREVENLAATVPSTTKLLDDAFSRDAIVPHLNDYNIVHFATHAAFVTGTPEESFILFGNGERITLRDVETWSLPNVDLVVLSACETGVGGQLGNGEEILGFGYQMQLTGARSAIASLWSVSDGGTQALMDAFYAALQNNNITKAEALRQAQIALITGNYTAVGQQRGIAVQQRVESNLPRSVTTQLRHPFYWAPFISIGNGF